MEIIKVENLYAKYSKKLDYAISDINLAVNAGEIVGLLGANGAGKSTTLKCLTGMLEATSGDITICGNPLKTQPLKAKQCFSFVSDNHAVFLKMTGWQYLNFMADVYGVNAQTRKTVFDTLEKKFNLGDSINSLIGGYSHGMKQKICMMGSLVHSPKLWILDEPMLGLDQPTMNSVISLMKKYAAQGNSILFSSHNLDVVKALCDRVIVIEKGKIIADINIATALKENESFDLKNYFSNKNENDIEDNFEDNIVLNNDDLPNNDNLNN
ncbi:MAG: ABC transporter ATP-binding protein [Clostridia bacterium]